MRYTFLLSVILLVVCNNKKLLKSPENVDTIKTTPEAPQVYKDTDSKALLPKTYSNKCFKDVTVERIGQDTFVVKGRGQIFESNFIWIVEDGHEELKKGFQITVAGAPEWGKFEFEFNSS